MTAINSLPANSDGPPEISADHFWPSLLRAVEVEPREIDHVRGASGVDHRFVAAGIDEEQRRLVCISGQGDAPGAALAQADLQAALSDFKVIVARPVIFDANAIGTRIAEKQGRPTLTGADLATISEGVDEDPTVNPVLGEMLEPLLQQINNARAVGSIDLIQGLQQFLSAMQRAKWTAPNSSGGEQPIVDFSSVLLENTDPHGDISLGICPIPLYAFSGDELEVVHGGSDEASIEQILRRHNLHQFFFPPRDGTTLGLIERGRNSAAELATTLESAPALGHPYGSPELLPTDADLPALIDILGERGYIVEGEVGYEITEKGRLERATIHFEPRESLVSKLINRFEVKLNLKSIFKIG